MGYMGFLLQLPKDIFYLLKGDYKDLGFRVYGGYVGFIAPIISNHMAKVMENEMEAGDTLGSKP